VCVFLFLSSSFKHKSVYTTKCSTNFREAFSSYHVITTLNQAKMTAIFLQSSALCQSILAAQQEPEFVGM